MMWICSWGSGLISLLPQLKRHTPNADARKKLVQRVEKRQFLCIGPVTPGKFGERGPDMKQSEYKGALTRVKKNLHQELISESCWPPAKCRENQPYLPD